MTRAPFVLPPAPADWLERAVPEPAPDVAWLDGYIQHFSPSSLRMLKTCPEQYRQRYLLGRKERPQERLTLGTAVHAALAFNDVAKIESHEDASTKQVIEYFNDLAWPNTIEKDGGVNEIQWKLKPEEARKDGERVTISYHKVVSPRIQPVAVEHEFRYVVEGVAVPVYGFIDVVEEHNTVDRKIGAQVQKKPDANWRTQGAIYAAATGLPTHFHSASRAKTPSLATPLEHPEMSIEDVQRPLIDQLVRSHADLVEWYFNRFGPDEPWPTTGVFMDLKGGSACNFCGFRKFCVAWEHERIVHVPKEAP